MKMLFGRSTARAIILSLVAGLGLWAPGAAMSANINIDDLTDSTAVSATQFDVTAATITHMNIFGGEDDVRITGQFLSNSAAGLSFNGFAIMLEPGCVGQNCVSDSIHVIWSTGQGPGNLSIATIQVDFGSDPESLGGCGGLCGPNNTIVENGNFQLINGLVSLPDNITIFVRSDVPEPASLALLGIGLAGLGLRRRQRAA